jgi:hypothetical protein
MAAAPRAPSFFFTRTRVRNSAAVIGALLAAGYVARALVVSFTVEDYRAHERVRQSELEAVAADAAKAARPTTDVDWRRVWRNVLAEERRLEAAEAAATAAAAQAAAQARTAR